MYLKFTYKYY